MSRTVTSNAITFIDTLDSRKLYVYISSNLPITQIYNSNTRTYAPDWSTSNLTLTADIYLDSTKISAATLKWYKKINGTKTSLGNSSSSLTIVSNVLSNNPIITYICEAEYDGIASFSEITFTRVDAGANGTNGINGQNGANAPAVKAQYSINGNEDWKYTFDPEKHKYIRHSYDGGTTWSAAIKMVGEDGTSVAIKGTATSVTAVSGTNYYTVAYNDSTVSTAQIGDSYLYKGDLYVCADSKSGNDYFVNVGKIQGPTGPTGNDGVSSYVFIRYATDADGTNMAIYPSGKTYIGVCISNINQAPTTARSYTWSKFVGEDAKSIVLSGTSQVFKVNKSNSITPSIIQVTAQSFNTTITQWTYSTDGGMTFTTTTPSGVSISGNTVTITGTQMTSNSIVIKASDGKVEDVFTIYKAIDGSDGSNGDNGTPAPIAFLTNENVTFSADEAGQIAATTITSNVVAYNGTTKVEPTIGTITGIPTGMTITSSETASKEIMLTLTVDENATLGSALSNMGSINILITSPVSTMLSLTWSKINTGESGVSIKSTTIMYGVSESASSMPEDNEWQSDVPIVGDGKYLWTRTIIDYTDDDIEDTVTYTYAKQGIKGDAGLDGESITVLSIEYQEGESATDPPTEMWSNSIVEVADGNYLWTKTTFSDNNIAYGVSKQGEKGKDGAGVNSITVDYGVSDSAAVQPTSWQQDIPVVAEGGYLWTRTITDYSDESMPDTVAYIYAKQGTKGETGSNGSSVTVKSIKYQSGTSATVAPTGTWSDSVVAVAEGSYLWTQTTFSDNKVAYGVAKQGVAGTAASHVSITPSAHYFKSTTGKNGTFTPEYIYIYPRFQTVTFSAWQYSIDGGVTWVAASGANGLTVGTYSSVANTLRIARTSTLYTDTVTSISFRCVSSNTSVYDTVSIAKIYDVVDLEIGGRNLLLNSGIPVTNTVYNIKKYDLAIKPTVGEQYTITLKGKLGDNKTSFSAYNSGGNVSLASLTRVGTSDIYQKTFNWTNNNRTDLDTSIFIYTMPNSVTTESTIEWIKLEKGNKATDWSPAPEDIDADITKVDTRLTNSLAEVKATTDGITSKISATEESITTINGSLSSLTTKVSAAEQKITTSAIVSTVRQSTDYINDLGTKVGTNEIISKINQTAESVTISANKIGLLGATNIPDLTADKIKGGTLTLGGSSATTQNGQLLVKNASNADVLKVNKDGIIAKSGHLAIAKDFANQTYDWDTGIWTTTTNTSQLDLGDDYIQMGVYSPSGYSNTMRLLDDGLRFQGIAQAVGGWGSYIGHDTYGDFIIQDTVRSNISFRDSVKNEMASISGDGLYINGPVSGGITSGNAKQWSNVFTKNFTSQHTGYIAIRLGTITRAVSSMITIKGHITSYWDSSSFEASCYFYNGYSSFYGTVSTISNPDTLKEVYFAEGVSDGCVYLILGGSDSTWYYPTVAIDNLSVGYSGNAAYEWNSNWTATLHTNLSSFKTVTSCSRGGMKKTLWSGAVQIGATVTLNENLRNFKFLTCLMGDASAPWGIPLGTFLDDEVTELHFGAIYTGADSIAGGNLYGARFNILSQTSLSLQSMGTKHGAGAYLRKIVGWR